MSARITQKLVNQKCDLLKSQYEEITVNKVRKLIGISGASIIDLVDKVTLYKEDHNQAVKLADEEDGSLSQEKVNDELLDLIERVLKDLSIKEKDLSVNLRNDLKKYIDEQVAEKSKKIRERQMELSNKNDSLEISNLTLDRRYKELLTKYNTLKDEMYSLKQDYNAKSSKYLEQKNTEKRLLDIEEFKSFKEQLSKFEKNSMVAVYDNQRSLIIIKFPHTDFLTQECRKGRSNFLHSRTSFDIVNKVWELTNYSFKTIAYLRKKGFIFSQELETVIYKVEQLQTSQKSD